MSKSKRLKEWDEVQKLKKDNQKLRRENQKLRKVIKNVDFERYSFVQDLLSSFDYDKKQSTRKEIQQNLEEKWKCHECGEGVLRLVILFKVGEEFYFRKCDCCGKRTKLKKYTEDVKGVK